MGRGAVYNGTGADVTNVVELPAALDLSTHGGNAVCMMSATLPSTIRELKNPEPVLVVLAR